MAIVEISPFKVGRGIAHNDTADGYTRSRFIRDRLRRGFFVAGLGVGTVTFAHAPEVYAAVLGDKNVAIRFRETQFGYFECIVRRGVKQVFRPQAVPAAEPGVLVRFRDQEINDLEVACDPERLVRGAVQLGFDVERTRFEMYVDKLLHIGVRRSEFERIDHEVEIERRIRQHGEPAAERYGTAIERFEFQRRWKCRPRFVADIANLDVEGPPADISRRLNALVLHAQRQAVDAELGQRQLPGVAVRCTRFRPGFYVVRCSFPSFARQHVEHTVHVPIQAYNAVVDGEAGS